MSTETLTHALTIHQPYAWALAAGHKPVENRTWRPPLEMVGKLIGIHAGLGPKREHSSVTMERWVGVAAPLDCAIPSDLPTGALIGVARLVGVVRGKQFGDGTWQGGDFRILRGRSLAVSEPLPVALCERIRPWWRGPWGWLLEEAVLLPEPIPMRGQQGLWRLTGCDDGEGDPPDPTGWTSNRYFNVWALEQWRKAREVVR